MKKNIVWTVLALLAFASAAVGIFVYQHVPSTPNLSAVKGTALSTPRTMPDFDFAATNGGRFDNARLQGHWTLLFFGFSNCGTICPVTMGELAKTYRLMEAQHLANLPQVVMVSIDPARDSLDKLREYVSAFDVHFMGARAESARIKALSETLGLAYEKVATPQKGDDYEFQHSGTVMLINPQGKLVAFFTMPHHAEDIINDYKILSQQ